jgi:RNA polymerase sigma-70 factor (ECF subfamily)
MSVSSDDRGPSARFDAEELLRHATWLRALARALVRPDEVDDVVQETWATALAHPPDSFAALRSWLDRVARNVALQFARSTRRRAEREEVASPREAQPSTADVVARAALHRELVGRVLALDEPTRTVVLLRFFDGLRAAQIAARVGASEEAVRQRLKRGLERMRAQLDAEHGGKREEWLGGFAVLASGAGAGSGVAAVGWKGVAMGAPGKFAIAAVVVCATASWFLWPRSRPNDEGARVDAAARTSEANAARSVTGAAATEASEKADAASIRTGAQRSPDAPAAPPVRFVYGALVDAGGGEMDHVSIRVFSTDPETRLEPTRDHVWELDSKRGAFGLAGLPAGRFELHASATGFLPVTREFEVGDGDDGVRVDLAFRRKIAIPIVLRAPDGRRLVEAFGEKDPDVPLRYLTVLACPDAPPDRLPLISAAAADVSSLARWISGPNMRFGNRDDESVPVADGVDGILLLQHARPFFAVVAWRHVVLASSFVADPDHMDGALEWTIDPARITASLATVRIRCVTGNDARPAANVQVRLDDDQGWTHATATTDNGGIATLTRIPPGYLDADIAGRIEYLRVDAGATTEVGPLDLSSRESGVSVRVVDDASRPVAIGVSGCTLDEWRHGRPIRNGNSFAPTPVGRIGFFVSGRRVRAWIQRDDVAVEPIVFDPSTTRVIELHARPGTRVDFEYPDGFPLLPTIFEVTAADGTLIESRWGLGTLALRPGRYHLAAFRDEVLLAAADFEVGSTPMRVDVPHLPGPIRDLDASRSRAADPAVPTPAAAIDPASDPVRNVVFGRIVEGAGDRFAGGAVLFRRSDNFQSESPIHGGCYALAGILPGGVEVFARGKSSPGFHEWIDVAPEPKVLRHDFGGKDVTRIDVELIDAKSGAPLGEVPAEFVSRGEALDLDVVVAHGSTTMSPACFRWTDNHGFPGTVPHSGFFEFDGALPIDVRLRSGGAILGQQRIATPVKKIVFPVDWASFRSVMATLRVRLVDAATGAPLAPTALYVTTIGSFYSRSRDDSRRLDEAGTREISGLAPTLCKLIVETPGHERIEHGITLLAGLNDLGTLALAAPRLLTGRVVDAQGQAVRCSLRIRDVERAERALALAFQASAFADEHGHFALPIGAGAHEVAFLADRFAATTVVVPAGTASPAELEVVLHAGTPVAIRSDELGDCDAAIVIEDVRRSIVARGRAGIAAFRLRLEPGRYVARAFARDAGEELAKTPFVVTDAPLAVTLLPAK